MKCIKLLKLIKYSDERLIFIVEGEVSLHKRHYGKIAKVTSTGTLGED